jgi:hypothetical protein
MRFRHSQQRPRGASGRAPALFPFRQGAHGEALVQCNFRDNRLNIKNYLGLFAGFYGAGRPESSYEDNRLILNDLKPVFSQIVRLNPAQKSQLHNNPRRAFIK